MMENGKIFFIQGNMKQLNLILDISEFIYNALDCVQPCNFTPR